MPTSIEYENPGPSRAEVEALAGATVLEFGTSWCGFCRAAQPVVSRALEGRAGLRHLKVEDGSGRALGRSFRVKLWPTLVFLQDGVEVARVVRPGDEGVVLEALGKLAA